MGGSATGSADFFFLGGGRSPIAGDEGDEFGEVAIELAEIAMGVGEGFGDLQEERRIAVFTGLRRGFEKAPGEAGEFVVFLLDVVAFGVAEQGVFGAADDAKIGEVGVVGLADTRAVFVGLAALLELLNPCTFHVI